MIAPLRPGVELLETRTLQAGSASLALLASLSASRAGSDEALTLTETNTTGQAVNVTIGCGVVDFWATQGGAEVWRRSKEGPQPLCPISMGGVLEAHASRTFTATWDGRFHEAMPPGSGAPIVLHASVDGLSAEASNVPGLVVTLATDRSVYQDGQPVVMTLMWTNTGTQDVNVAYGPGTDGFYVTQGDVEVWRSNLGPQPQALFVVLKTLHPGESFTQSATWDGVANEGPSASTPTTGPLTVHSDVPGANAVEIQVGPPPGPLHVTVTTDRTTYHVGQAVRITVRETDTGSAPVNVGGPGAVRVTILGQGVEVWKRATATKKDATVLAPGQGRQFTVTWPGQFHGHPRTPRTGPFVIQGFVDGVPATTTIQVERR